jgi:hypothetical protein
MTPELADLISKIVCEECDKNLLRSCPVVGDSDHR